MFEKAYDRICSVLGIRTQVQLAEILGIRQSSISDAKRRNAIPAEWLVTLYEQRCVNPVWVKNGTGSVFVGPMARPVDPLEEVGPADAAQAEDCLKVRLAVCEHLLRKAARMMGPQTKSGPERLNAWRDLSSAMAAAGYLVDMQ